MHGAFQGVDVNICASCLERHPDSAACLAAFFQDVVDEPQVRVPQLQQRIGVHRNKHLITIFFNYTNGEWSTALNHVQARCAGSFDDIVYVTSIDYCVFVCVCVLVCVSVSVSGCGCVYTNFLQLFSRHVYVFPCIQCMCICKYL